MDLDINMNVVYVLIPLVLAIVSGITAVYFLYLRSKMRSNANRQTEMMEALIMFVLTVVFVFITLILMKRYDYYI